MRIYRITSSAEFSSTFTIPDRSSMTVSLSQCNSRPNRNHFTHDDQRILSLRNLPQRSAKPRGGYPVRLFLFYTLRSCSIFGTCSEPIVHNQSMLLSLLIENLRAASDRLSKSFWIRSPWRPQDHGKSRTVQQSGRFENSLAGRDLSYRGAEFHLVDPPPF